MESICTGFVLTREFVAQALCFPRNILEVSDRGLWCLKLCWRFGLCIPLLLCNDKTLVLGSTQFFGRRKNSCDSCDVEKWYAVCHVIDLASPRITPTVSGFFNRYGRCHVFICYPPTCCSQPMDICCSRPAPPTCCQLTLCLLP